MTLARAELRERLTRRVARARRRWLHPSSSRQAGERFLSPLTLRHPSAVLVAEVRPSGLLRTPGRAGGQPSHAGHPAGRRTPVGRTSARNRRDDRVLISGAKGPLDNCAAAAASGPDTPGERTPLRQARQSLGSAICTVQ
jgi:hypothetical protein